MLMVVLAVAYDVRPGEGEDDRDRKRICGSFLDGGRVCQNVPASDPGIQWTLCEEHLAEIGLNKNELDTTVFFPDE